MGGKLTKERGLKKASKMTNRINIQNAGSENKEIRVKREGGRAWRHLN